MSKTIDYETRLLNGTLTVSELSATSCREILKRIITRHRGALAQMEHQKRAEEVSIPKLEIVKEGSSDLPVKK